jgi:hypothetical protein
MGKMVDIKIVFEITYEMNEKMFYKINLLIKNIILFFINKTYFYNYNINININNIKKSNLSKLKIN